MQLHFLALLLSAGSLALPTENALDQTAPDALTKRGGHFAWAAAYAPDDWACKKGVVNNDRPEVIGGCYPLPVRADNWFGINWGTWPYAITDSVVGYSDNNCMNKVGEIQASNKNNTNKHGVNTCVLASWYGGPFGSVSALGGSNNNNDPYGRIPS